MKLSMHKDFPKKLTDLSKYHGEQMNGFNEALSLLGDLEVLEPLDEKEVDSFLANIVERGQGYRDMGRIPLAKAICKRFGTSAVGTGKQVDESSVEFVCNAIMSHLITLSDLVSINGDSRIISPDNWRKFYAILKNDFISKLLSHSLGTKEVDEKLFREIIELKKDKRDLESHLNSLRLALTNYKGQHPNIEYENVPCSKCSSKFNSANVANFINILERTGKWNTLSPLEKGIYIYKEFSPARSEVDEKEILRVIRAEHTKNMNLGFGARKTDEQMDEVIAKAISAFLRGE